MKAFYFAQHDVPLPPGHRFPASKYRLLRERVEGRADISLNVADGAVDADLLRVHTADYVEAVQHGRLSAAAQREIGFAWSPLMPLRARGSVGATIAAARVALHEGVAVNLGGGTHHAHADKGGGFCIFNDTAVAARLMQAEWQGSAWTDSPALNIAVIDLDVHQGDGTASIFEGDPTVFTLSLHGARNFPFRKVAGRLDVALPDGCADDPYLAALDDALGALWQFHVERPIGFVFFLAGADPHEGDRLGRLKLTAAGLRERDRRVLRALRERHLPVALSMAGGYGHRIEDTVDVQVATIDEALASWREWNNPAA